MPTSLQKVKKNIAKKRGGVVNSLHARSRDSKKLHKAGVRDVRLEKLANARNKREQPIGADYPLPLTHSDDISNLSYSRASCVFPRWSTRARSRYIRSCYRSDAHYTVCPPVNDEYYKAQDVLTNPRFVNQYDEEYDEVKKARRPGRPASVREDLLKMKIAALNEEYEKGFGM